jgi:hypothetical protein
MGWLVLGSLTAFALLDSVALALRMAPRGRAELGIATALFFAALLSVPILALGYCSLLWKWTLAPASFLLLTAVFVVLARGCGPQALLASCRAAFRDLAALPVDALREAFRARSIVILGLLLSAALIAIAFVLTYLIEFCRWDDEIYHTPIVGWAIQLHGFDFVNAPKPGVGGLNGYPKLVESLSLWFVIFTDKTLLELPATLYAAPMMLSVYALARRYTDAVCAMAFAIVMLLVPHSWRQFCSSYVDMEVAFFFLAATYYASRPDLRFRDAALCVLAMSLAAASKGTWVMFVPPIALVACVRLARAHFAKRRRDVLLTITAGLVAVVGFGAPCFGRNWLHYGNPVWPVGYDFPSLGIHWPGIFTPQDYRGRDPSVFEGFGPPQGGMYDVMRHGYGLAIMWVAGPIGAAAIVLWGVALCHDLVQWRLSDAVRSVGAVIFICVVWIVVGPNFGQPRYNLHVIAAFVIACAWLFRSRRWTRAREGMVSAMLVLSFLQFFWLGNSNPSTLEEESERLSHPFANRAYSLHPQFDLIEREKYEELHRGDEVVFSQGVDFPGLLWNFDFSNRVDYVEFTDPAQFMAKLDELKPKWVCVGATTLARRLLDESGQWELIGRTNTGLNEVAFRRKDADEPRG